MFTFEAIRDTIQAGKAYIPNNGLASNFKSYLAIRLNSNTPHWFHG
jgi:hypothetical protein